MAAQFMHAVTALQSLGARAVRQCGVRCEGLRPCTSLAELGDNHLQEGGKAAKTIVPTLPSRLWLEMLLFCSRYTVCSMQ